MSPYLRYCMIFFLLPLILSCSNKKKKNYPKSILSHVQETQKDTIINFVYKVHNQIICYESDTQNPKEHISEVQGFDQKGNLIEEIKYNENSSLQSHTFFLYKNNKIDVEYRSTFGSMGNLYKTCHFYSANNLLDSTTIQTYKFRIKEGLEFGITGKNGCIIMPEDYDSIRSWGNIEVYEKFIYNSDGKIASKENGNTKTVYEYTSNGKIFREIELSNDDTSRFFLTKYEPKVKLGYLKDFQNINKNKLISKCYYDSNNNEIEYQSIQADTIEQKHIYDL